MAEVNCPFCGKAYTVKSEILGKSAKCKCGKTFMLEEGELKLADETHAPAPAGAPAAPPGAPAAVAAATDTHVEPGETDLFPETPQFREYIHAKCGKATVVQGDMLRLVTTPPFVTYGGKAGTLCAHCKMGDIFARFRWKDTGESVGAYRWRLLFRDPICGGTSVLVRLLLVVLIPLAGFTLAVLTTKPGAYERAIAWKLGLGLGLCVAMCLIWGIHRISPPDYRRYR
jgi:hypothetical protein